MKKTIGLFVAGIACFWGLSACGTTHSTTTTSTSTASHTQKKAESLIVNGGEMTLTDFGEKTLLDTNQKKQNIYSVHVKGKNVSADMKGLGAIDFLLKTDKGEQTINMDFASFGDELDKGETIEGDLYFQLKKGETPKAIEYKPTDKVMYSWKIDDQK